MRIRRRGLEGKVSEKGEKKNCSSVLDGRRSSYWERHSVKNIPEDDKLRLSSKGRKSCVGKGTRLDHPRKTGGKGERTFAEGPVNAPLTRGRAVTMVLPWRKATRRLRGERPLKGKGSGGSSFSEKGVST